MELSFEEMKEKMDEYVTGYYCGRKVNLELDSWTDSSYYSPNEDCGKISYRSITNMLKLIPEGADADSIIRTVFYHELSHAILTPRNMPVTDILNIFEDERIETILANYYMHINFKDTVKLLNNYKGEEPNSAMSAFYHLVRYRVCANADFLPRVDELIKKYRILTRRNWAASYNYREEVQKLFNDVREWWDSHSVDLNPPKETQEGGQDNSGENADNDQKSSEGSETKEGETSKSDEGEPKEAQQDNKEATATQTITEAEGTPAHGDDDARNIFTEEEVKEIIQAGEMNCEYSYKVLGAITRMIEDSKKAKRRNGGLVNAYSGRIDPRSCAREDYRFFQQEKHIGNGKVLSNIKLNLFIDVSGSFHPNQGRTNAILKALADLEKANRNFKFDVVTIAMDNKLLDRNKRQIYCGGGNRLKKSIVPIYRQLQDRTANNVNIVLFDGDMVSDCRYGAEEADLQNMKVWDNKNTIVISDPYNKKYFDTRCTGTCRTIYTEKYVDTLEDNIIKALGLLL